MMETVTIINKSGKVVSTVSLSPTSLYNPLTGERASISSASSKMQKTHTMRRRRHYNPSTNHESKPRQLKSSSKLAKKPNPLLRPAIRDPPTDHIDTNTGIEKEGKQAHRGPH